MENLAERLKQKFPNIVLDAFDMRGIPAAVVRKEGIKSLAASVKTDPEFQFNVLMDLTAVDYLFWEEKECRFEVVYHLFSIPKNQRLILKAAVSESDAEIDSVTPVWVAADWFEREVYDMFGLKFKGHPNLKRILMYQGFEGHPLRKDYPYNKRQPLVGPIN
ncbi:MAG: NADH-quinone oxidoreductase subunit C [Candidatus Omnitrophota bacterium]